MDRFFRVDETGLTLHIPALPDDPSALLWLIGFALVLSTNLITKKITDGEGGIW